MSIKATQVKELRERTGLGMMECKKALQAAQGDIEKAIEELRKSGLAKVAKTAGRTAAEGSVAIRLSADGKSAYLIEVNSETDFVARDEHFSSFVDKVLDSAVAKVEIQVEALLAGDLEAARTALIQKVGENVRVRRIGCVKGEVIGCYVHGNQRIAVAVALSGGSVDLAKDIAMHVAAVNPRVVSREEMPQELIKKEKAIFTAQAQQSGKPEAIIKKMVTGRISKYLAENSLLEQAFVKDPELTVGKMVQESGATVLGFRRFEVGEGIEKRVVDFASEVAATASMVEP